MTFVLNTVFNIKSSHATRHETLVHSHFSSLSHCGLSLPYGVKLVRATDFNLQKRAGFPQKSSCSKKRLPPPPQPPPPQSYRLTLALLGFTVLSTGHWVFSGRTEPSIVDAYQRKRAARYLRVTLRLNNRTILHFMFVCLFR